MPWRPQEPDNTLLPTACPVPCGMMNRDTDPPRSGPPVLLLGTERAGEPLEAVLPCPRHSILQGKDPCLEDKEQLLAVLKPRNWSFTGIKNEGRADRALPITYRSGSWLWVGRGGDATNRERQGWNWALELAWLPGGEQKQQQCISKATGMSKLSQGSLLHCPRRHSQSRQSWGLAQSCLTQRSAPAPWHTTSPRQHTATQASRLPCGARAQTPDTKRLPQGQVKATNRDQSQTCL